MKIVLTGANGYLGSNLMLSLSESHELLPVSLLSTSVEDLDKKLIEFNPHVVIHCGWGLGNSYNDVSDIKQIDNILIGCEFLKSISKLNNITFIGFGTFSEYGTINKPAKETDDNSPVDFYGTSKKSFRVVSKNLCRLMNHRWLWVRPCYVYGKNDVKSRLIPKVFDSCLENKKIILNSCKSVVDYLYIEDFCSAINRLLKYETSGIYNVCSGKEYLISDVINSIQEITGVYNTITYDKSLERGKSYAYICGDNKKLKSIGWTPSYDFTRGLSDTLEYYSNLKCETTI